MLDYFARRLDLTWWENPHRPAPPIYTRLHNTRQTPAADTPIGPITDSDLVQLTDEQVYQWNHI